MESSQLQISDWLLCSKDLCVQNSNPTVHKRISICTVKLNSPASPSNEMASVNDFCNLLQMCCYFEFDENIKSGDTCLWNPRSSMLYIALYELLFMGVEMCFCKIAAD